MPSITMVKFGSWLNMMVYKRSGGKLMGSANNLPILLLTTIGRKSGNPHTRPVVYLKDDDTYIIMPGVVPQPDWLLNLLVNPMATIQVKDQMIVVQSNKADEAKRSYIWETVPSYWRDYQAKTDEPLTIMLLIPQPSQPN